MFAGPVDQPRVFPGPPFGPVRQTLALGSAFNQSLAEVPLPRLEALSFGGRFDQVLGLDAPVLRSLEFGYAFNQTLREVGQLKRVF